MKRLINKFAEKILNTTKSFMIETKEYNMTGYNFFMQCNVGEARYVYKEHSHKENFHTDLSLTPELVAIISDGKIYIVDEYGLGVWGEDTELPENTFRITDIIVKKNEYVESVIFADFYKSLEENPITDEDLLEKCTDEARRILFAKEPIVNETIKPMFSEQDIADSLCGVINLEAEAVKRLVADQENWIYKKSYNKKVKELMENHSVAEDYEMEIAEGIRSVDAKTVTVEFELNGKKESGKMNPDTIIRHMQNNDYFSGYDFEIAKRGDELIKKLDAAALILNSNGKEVLTCNHITKITYGKKELYVRK